MPETTAPIPNRFDDDYDTPEWWARVDAYYRMIASQKR